ncbi:hypothetical protein ACVLD2_002569 [Paenibacillus sp. PvR052]|nr:hypothetical protein [Paenibacillus sp. PvP091]MBP1172655.1 hypothetical protein [Paenibacillus sp. PvR098]MBP2439035.1 hypothetical protein [Paenibacillus sp. PvP052]
MPQITNAKIMMQDMPKTIIVPSFLGYEGYISHETGQACITLCHIFVGKGRLTHVVTCFQIGHNGKYIMGVHGKEEY